MIQGFAILLVCQLVGEAVTRALGLPVPGPVLGLALLVAGLFAWNRRRPFDEAALLDSGVGRVSGALLASLSIFFVPAGVGVVQYGGLIGAWGLALGVALVGSTLVTLIVTVGVFVVVKRLGGGYGEAQP
jgi:putative effector of murein hydrolase LrgA (UPF0299 family)